MTILGRLADPRLRPAWHGAAAAIALAAFIMTGAATWFLHPWRFAGLLAAGAAAAAWAWGLFGRHEGRHADKVMAERPRRELALPAIAPAPGTPDEFASMARLRGTAGQRAGYWQPRDPSPAEHERLKAAFLAAAGRGGHPRVLRDCPATLTPHDDGSGTQHACTCEKTEGHPGKHLCPYCGVARDLLSERRLHPFLQVPDPHVLICRCGKWPGHHAHTGDRAACTCDDCTGAREPAAVVVTGDPPGRHERPRAYQVTAEPYCSRCGTRGHWRGGQGCEDAVVGELLARRRDGHVAAAIAGHLEAAGLKVHASEDEALESMWTRAMGKAVAAIEGARRDG